MNSKIHPTARIHPSVIVDGKIEIGANTIIGANSYLKGPLVIGENNRISQQVMIGIDAEHRTKPSSGIVTIGNGNEIREFTVIQRGIGDLDTQIQNDCYIMAHTYIGHDCLIESDVVLCAKTALSGHCHILKGAILGVASSLHQFSTIGAHAFIGMGSIVVQDVPPFCTVVGNPARFTKFNSQALEKLGIKIENFQLQQSQHPYIKACTSSFNAHTRRKVLSANHTHHGFLNLFQGLRRKKIVA
jgi:UDP-N-acetylglucosamine acyltransferase